jgi:hypothetical protein
MRTLELGHVLEVRETKHGAAEISHRLPSLKR